MNYSVLISVYLKENPSYLMLALESTINQTIKPSEIVIVEDGSLTNELSSVIDSFKANFPNIVKVVKIPKNVGLGNALNIGLKQCTYKWVARMDSDDISCPDRLEKQLDFLRKNPETDVIGGWIEEFNVLPGDLKSIRKVPLTPEQVHSYARGRNPMNHMTVFFNKEAVLKVGNYQYFPLLEDQYLWFRLIKNGYKLANLPEILVYARVGNNMVGRRHGWRYFKTEVRLFNEFRKGGLIGMPLFVFNVSVRFFLRLLPVNLLKVFYKLFLR